MHLLDSNNQATSTDANAVGTVFLPRDVIVSILLCLPASDLRRFRLVCKEWRDIISETAFMDAQTDRGPRAPTHTIVFFPNCSGFLFDEQWRLTATFAAAGLGDMIGTCNKGSDDTIQEKLYLYTVGGGGDWRRVHVPDGDTHGGPVCADGAVD